MGTLADRRFEMTLRNRVLFGIGEIERLPEIVGVGRWVARLRRDRSGRPRAPASSTMCWASSRPPVSRPAASPTSNRTPAPRPSSAPRPRFGRSGSTTPWSCRWAAARPWTPRRPSTCAPPTTFAVWELEYDGPALNPGRPVIAVPTTAGTGAETNSFSVSSPTRRAGRKDYIGHPSLLPRVTILDPGLTVGLPPRRRPRPASMR